MISPAYEVNIWDFNEELVTIKLLVLAAWKSALKFELKTGMTISGTAVLPLVRETLSVPESYPDEEVYRHIKTSLEDIHSQLGI